MRVVAVGLLYRAGMDASMATWLHAARDEGGVLLERIASRNICCSVTAWDKVRLCIYFEETLATLLMRAILFACSCLINLVLLIEGQLTLTLR